jgi:hypothetical protein
MTTSLTDVLELQAGQEADEKEIQDLLAEAEGKIAALDQQGLGADAGRKKANELKDAAIKSIRDRRAAAQDRAKRAAAMQTAFTDEAFRRAALMKDANRVSATMSAIRHAATHELSEYARQAAEAGDVALCEALRLEFFSRQDRGDHIAGFATAFNKLKLSEAAEARERLQKVRRSAALMDVRIAEVLRGHKNPVGRLIAVRTA